MFECPLCEQKCLDRRGLSNHLTRGHSDLNLSPLEKEKLIVYTLYSMELVEKTVQDYIKGEYSVNCLPISIGLYIKLLGVKRSHSEEKRSAGYKERFLASIEKKYGLHVENISQVPEIKAKIREASRVNFPGKKQSLLEGFCEYLKDAERVKETVRKIENTCLDRYGERNFGKGEEARKKAKESLRNFYDRLSYEDLLKRTSKARQAVCHRGGYSSKLEKRVRECIESLGITAKYNLHMWGFNFDIVWDNKILEVQGDLWHANPRIYKEDDLIMGRLLARDLWGKDDRKREKAQENGFIFIEIWEDEIKLCRTNDELTSLLQKLIDSNYDFS